MSINVIGKYVLNPFNMTLCMKSENAKINNGILEIIYKIHKLNLQILDNISLRFIKITIRIEKSNTQPFYFLQHEFMNFLNTGNKIPFCKRHT